VSNTGKTLRPGQRDRQSSSRRFLRSTSFGSDLDGTRLAALARLSVTLCATGVL